MEMDRLFSRKDLQRLIVPLVFEQALAITVGMADTMMVSSVGEAAISGVSLVDMINNLIFSVLAALSTGGAVVVSQNLGAKKVNEACHSAKQLLYTVIFAGTVIAVLCMIFRIPLLRLFFGRIEDDVMADGLTYLMITALSFPFLAVYNACAALFRSMGNAQITLKVSVLINVINIVGNALCIFVLKMGVAGVAVPSLVSRAVGGLILYVLLRNPREVVHFIKGHFEVEWSVIRKILYIGIPSGIENGIFQLGRVLVVSIISGFGTMQIAANGVANNLDAVGCIIGQAMNLAMITVIGRCVGANDEKQVRFYTGHLLFPAAQHPPSHRFRGKQTARSTLTRPPTPKSLRLKKTRISVENLYFDKILTAKERPKSQKVSEIPPISVILLTFCAHFRASQYYFFCIFIGSQL